MCFGTDLFWSLLVTLDALTLLEAVMKVNVLIKDNFCATATPAVLVTAAAVLRVTSQS